MIGFCKINKRICLSEADCYYCPNDFYETKDNCWQSEIPEWYYKIWDEYNERNK